MAFPLAQAPVTGKITGLTLTLTLASPTTPGNSLVVCIGTACVSATSAVTGVKLGGLADNFAAAEAAGSGSLAGNASIWVDPGCAGGQTSVQITVAGGSGASTDIDAVVYEVIGVASPSPVDQVHPGTGTATTWSSGSTPTTTQPSEIWFGCYCGADLAGGKTITPPGAFTNIATQQGAITYFTAGYQVVSATGAAAYAGNQNSGTQHWAAVIVTLTGGAAVLPPPPQSGRRSGQRAVPPRAPRARRTDPPWPQVTAPPVPPALLRRGIRYFPLLHQPRGRMFEPPGPNTPPPPPPPPPVFPPPRLVGGSRPRWAAKIARPRRADPPWPQGQRGAAFPQFTRRPGYSPRWAPLLLPPARRAWGVPAQIAVVIPPAPPAPPAPVVTVLPVVIPLPKTEVNNGADYRYLTTNLLTGKITGDHLPVEPGQFSRQISSSATGSAALQLVDNPVANAANLAAVVPRKSVLWVLQDDAVVWNGIIWDWQHTSILDGTLPLAASTMESILAHRVIGTTFTFTNTDIFSIIRSLIQYALNKRPNGQVAGITYSAGLSGITDTITFDGTQYQTVSDAIDTLVSTYEVEYSFRPYQDAQGNFKTSVDLGYPGLGLPFPQSGLVYNYPGNLTDYGFQASGSSASNFIVATASSDDESGDTYTALVKDAADLALGFPLSETSISVDGANFTSNLQVQKYAQGYLPSVTDTQLTPTLTLTGGVYPQIKATPLGSWAQLALTSRLHPARANGAPGFSGPGRVTGWTLQPSSGDNPETTTILLGDMRLNP